MPFINISLAMDQKTIDLRIPTQITVKKLSYELNHIFNRPFVGKTYQLFVVNKGLLLSEGDFLSDYPITTGDYLHLEEF